MNYKLYFNLKELIPKLDQIIDKAIKFAEVVDGLDENKASQLRVLMGLIYDEPFSASVYSIYGKYDEQGKENDPTIYYSNIAKRLYQAIMPLWQSKQFFNGNMDWKEINDLLTQSKKRQQLSTRKAKSKTDMNNKNESEGQSGHFINGNDHGEEIDYSPNYKSEGDKSKDTVTMKNEATNRNIEQSAGKFIESTTNIKLDYLKQIEEMIARQQFLLVDSFYEFIYSISIPNQNVTRNPFPWVWRLI